MSDLGKFCQIAKNIINYPYDKAIYYRKDWIIKVEINTESFFGCDKIAFYNYSNFQLIEIMFEDGSWIRADTRKIDRINRLIEKIKEKCNEEIKEALLKGIK